MSSNGSSALPLRARTPETSTSVANPSPHALDPSVRPGPDVPALHNAERTRSILGVAHPKKAAYLEGLRVYPVVRHGCEVAGVCRSTVQLWRKKDPAFAALELQCTADGVERLEADMWRRAHGVDAAPSDLLTIFTMKAHKPELYRETVDHRVIGKVSHEIVIDLVRPTTPQPPGPELMSDVVDAESVALVPAGVAGEDSA